MQKLCRRFPRRTNRALTVAVETLERRLQMDATYALLSPTSSLVQNWSNTGLITANNTWSGVPSIEGYRGDKFTGTSADPQLDTMVDPNPTIYVQANKVSPDDSGVNGGVAEFELNNPVVAIGGGNKALVPYLQLYINTTTLSNVHVSYNVRDLQTTATTQQRVALQYRIGETGNFTNVPAADVDSATDGGDTKVTAVSVDLPAVVAGNAKVQLRIMTTDAAGNNEWVGIDDIVVSAGNTVAFSTPTYSVNENAGTATVTVTRTGDTSVAASVNYATVAGGTATAGADYTSVNSTLNFIGGQATATFTVPITNDASPEGTESIKLLLTSPAGMTLGAASSATLNILDNDVFQPNSVLLNELDVNPPGTDDGAEFIELEGPVNKTLYNVYVAAVNGNLDTPQGTADVVFNLNNKSLDANGLLLINSTTDSQLSTAVLQNNTNSFLLIYSPTPITSRLDLDTDNDGNLDLPAGAVLMDAVGWNDGDVGDKVYGGVSLTQSSGIPDAATRFPTNIDPFSFDGWYNGDLASGSPSSTIYDATKHSTNFPNGGVLTPGAVNSAGSGGGAIGFSASGYTVNEQDGNATLTLNRINGSLGQVTVDYSITGGNATLGSDYTGGSGTVTFANGQTSASITLPIIDDGTAEATKALTFAITHATGGATTGPRTSATLALYDNDGSVPSGLVINEVDVNPPTNNDNPQEYIELRGNPNQTLYGVYLAVTSGDTGATGQAEAVFDLSGSTLGSNGLLVIGAPDSAFTYDSGTHVLTSPLFDANSGALPNSSTSFLLFFSTTGITTGDDLDTNDDGTLDLPAGRTLVDGIGWVDGDAGDLAYGAVLTQSSGTPDAATRYLGDLTPLSAAAWYNGDLLNTAGNVSLGYDNTKASSVFPSDGALTPGAANVGTIATPPSIDQLSFTFNPSPAGAKQQLVLDFSEDVFASFGTDDITLTRTTTPAGNVPADHIQFAQGATPNVIILTFTYPYGALPDGQYHLVVHHEGINDASNNVLSADGTLDFGFLNADANGDSSVNALDFNILATNFGQSGTFTAGDFNYDGTVNSDDFTVLSTEFGQILPPPPGPAPALGSLFSTSAIVRPDDLSELAAILD